YGRIVGPRRVPRYDGCHDAFRAPRQTLGLSFDSAAEATDNLAAPISREDPMTTVTKLTPARKFDSEEWQLRVDLPAAFRLAAELGWHEAVANHFSLAVSSDGKKFLMNPRWKHFSRIKASDLQLLDAADKTTMDRPDAPDPSAWCIHGAIHATAAQARCILHV